MKRTISISVLLALLFCLLVSGFSASGATEAYENKIKGHLGATANAPKVHVSLRATLSGKTVTVTLQPTVDADVTDCVTFLCQLRYDSERLTPTTPIDDAGAMLCVTKSPSGWSQDDNLTSLSRYSPETIDVAVAGTGRNSKPISASEPLILTFTFALKDGFSEAGVVVPHLSIQGENDSFSHIYAGTGTYAIVTRPDVPSESSTATSSATSSAQTSSRPTSSEPESSAATSSETASSTSEPESDFVYKIQNHCAILTSYRGSAHGVTVPAMLGGCPVTEIGEKAFSGCTRINTVNLPTSVRSIGANAFENCVALSRISLPSGLTSIGSYAFAGCGSLTDTLLPNSLQTIGRNAFSYCASLKQMALPASLQTVGKAIFYRCDALRDVYCGASEKPTDWSADWLSGCDAEVHWSRGTNTEDPSDSSAPSAGDADPSDFRYTVQDGVVTIDRYLGDGGEVRIPAQIDGNPVKHIAENAFTYCTSLTRVFLPIGLETVGDRAFLSCSSLAEVLFPDGVTVVGQNAFAFCESLQSIALPSSLQTVGDAAFSGCRALERVSLLNGIASLGNQVFFGCVSLRQITIPGSVSAVGAYVFLQCENLERIDCELTDPLPDWDENWNAGCEAEVFWLERETASKTETTYYHPISSEEPKQDALYDVLFYGLIVLAALAVIGSVTGLVIGIRDWRKEKRARKESSK